MSTENKNKNELIESSKVSPTGGDLEGTGVTLFQKIWQKHLVKTIPEGPDVIYIDKHFIHEVTSPQAFA